jgi:Reverse transcriptase (RNA-dependent DNA polymerase)
MQRARSKRKQHPPESDDESPSGEPMLVPRRSARIGKQARTLLGVLGESGPTGSGSTKSWRRQDESQIEYYESTSRGLVVRRANLVDQKRKRVVVVPYAEGVAIPEMRKAMKDELLSCKSNDCYNETHLADLPRSANLISTKWVLTIKILSDGAKRYKARLVARGFEDMEKALASADEPTASSAAQHLFLAALAQRQWRPHTWDWKTAFLQGNPLTRYVWLVAPEEFAGPGVVWKLKRPVYGLVSAPKAWFDRLAEVLQEEGFHCALNDEGIFRLIDRDDGAVVDILALHVDNAIGGGTKEFHGVMSKVGEVSEIGSHETCLFARD